MLRKIFSSVLLVIFLTNSMNNAFAVFVEASVPNMTNQMIYSKERIKEMKNWSRYLIQLNKIDKFIWKQTDLDLLEKIRLKLETKLDLARTKDQLTYELLNYIDLVVDKRIDELLTLESADLIKQLEKTTLSKEEIKKVEDEIVKLQINLLDSSKTFIDKLLSDLKKSVNVEKTWNMKLNVEWSWAMFWNWKWELSIKNIKSRNANFDSELEAQIDLLVDASVRWWAELKVQFSSFVNFISKDGNMYLLLQKLNYSWLDNLDYSGQYISILDKIKSIWNNNQYVKIEDKQSAMIFNMIKNFDLNSIYSEANKVLQQPMLKPYKKEWDKYLLVPTKKACDTIKYINYKINSYWSYTCSDSDYNNMLKEVVKSWDMYIIVDWTDKHLWMESNKYWVEWYAKIYFSDKKVEKILAKSEITAGKDKWTLVELDYVNWQKLNLWVTIPTSNNPSMILSFKSVLTTDNKFSKIDYIWDFSSRGQWFKSSFKLENKKFIGKFNLVGNKDANFVWNTSWELNTENDLSVFNFEIKSTNNSQKYNYDYATWTSTSTPTKTTLDLNYALKNEVIIWTISMKVDNQELFSVKSNWKYRKEYFELNNVIAWTDSTNIEKVNWNLNTKFVWNLENNTFDLYIDVDSKEWYVKINLMSDAKVEYKDDIKIEAPTNYKNLEDIIDNKKVDVQDSPENIAPEFFY